MSIWMRCMGLPEVNDHSGALGFALGLHLAHLRHRSDNNAPLWSCRASGIQLSSSLDSPFLQGGKTCFCLLATKLGYFELYVACSSRKYGVFSFIATKTCVALFASNWAFSSIIAAVNRFLFQFSTSDAFT